MRLKQVAPKGKYLGLPLKIGAKKQEAFAEVNEKVQKKMQGWKMKILSQARRTTLIRFVASSIASYIMSSFILPKSVTSKLDSLFCRFQWGVCESKSHACFLK